jgi:hypothetical protein
VPGKVTPTISGIDAFIGVYYKLGLNSHEGEHAMNIVLGPWQVLIITLVIAGGQFFASTWLKSSIENSIKAKYDLELKAKERAERVAEYMALARMLKETSSEEDYQKANRLSWELAMWLPSDVYRSMGKALSKPSSEYNPLSVVISVRKELLGSATGNLTQEDIIHHAPGIGKK